MNSKLFAVLAVCSRALKMQQPLSWKGIFAFRWSANIAVHSLHHYTKILFHKEAFSFLSFFPRPFKIGSHSCLRSWTREETTEKPTQLSPKQKYSKLGPGCNVSIVPPGTKYECPYCPLPLLLPQLLRPLCPSCSCNTSPPLHPIVPPCPPPSCPSPGVVLCEAWTWARRRAVSGGNQYLSRALPTKEPKIYGYSRLQWAIYKGAAILTSLQLKELGRQWQNGRRSNKDLWFSLHTPTLQTNDKSKKNIKDIKEHLCYINQVIFGNF